MHSALLKGHLQTVQTQIRRHKTSDLQYLHRDSLSLSLSLSLSHRDSLSRIETLSLSFSLSRSLSLCARWCGCAFIGDNIETKHDTPQLLTDLFKLQEQKVPPGVNEFNYSSNLSLSGWLVGWLGFNSPLSQYFCLYRAVAPTEGGRRGK